MERLRKHFQKLPAGKRRKLHVVAADKRSRELCAELPAEPKVTPKPAATRATSGVDDDLELRVLRAFYPDGISPDQYPRALRVLCLASEVEP